MNLHLITRLRGHLAVRRACRRRRDTVQFFNALPHDMQRDLLRPSLFEDAEETTREIRTAEPHLRLG